MTEQYSNIVKFSIIVLLIALVAGIGVVALDSSNTGDYLEQDTVAIIDKREETDVTPMFLGKILTFMSNNKYYVKVSNEKYGDREIESRELYYKNNIGDKVTIKVYKDMCGNYSLRW